MSEATTLTVDEAVERLAVIPDYDPGGEGGPRPCVHTFRNGSGMLLGAHWDLNDARAAMEEYGVSQAGPEASATHHALVTIDKTGPIFWETKPSPPEKQAP